MQKRNEPGRQPFFFVLLVFRRRHLGGGGLGDERLRLPHPVFLLDAAAQRERLVDIGDVVVGEIGDLVELDDAEPVQLRRQVRAQRP